MKIANRILSMLISLILIPPNSWAKQVDFPQDTSASQSAVAELANKSYLAVLPRLNMGHG